MTIEISVKHLNPGNDRSLIVNHVTGRPGDTGVVIQPLMRIDPGEEVRLVVYHGMFLAIAEHDPVAEAASPPAAPIAASEAA